MIQNASFAKVLAQVEVLEAQITALKADIAALREALASIRGVLEASDINCLGVGGGRYATDPNWPIRDEVVNSINKRLNTPNPGAELLDKARKWDEYPRGLAADDAVRAYRIDNMLKAENTRLREAGKWMRRHMKNGISNIVLDTAQNRDQVSAGQAWDEALNPEQSDE